MHDHFYLIKAEGSQELVLLMAETNWWGAMANVKSTRVEGELSPQELKLIFQSFALTQFLHELFQR